MAKIEAKEDRTFRVRSSLEKTYDAFANPEVIKTLMADLERHEIMSENKARWILQEKREKGTRFRADYTVVYDGNGSDLVRWHTTAGNLDTKGEAKLRKIDDELTEVVYRETLAPDLPIPKLMARVFKPIVAREVRKGITEYLERIQDHLGRA